ncbi:MULTISPECIES: hypothetical protein [Variovorax]|jgi:hypothetical protein|nr:hypothetical protein [Variovorax sp. 3319]MDR6888732.1 hypothetical protein [Variovorax sp. 3319]
MDFVWMGALLALWAAVAAMAAGLDRLEGLKTPGATEAPKSGAGERK